MSKAFRAHIGRNRAGRRILTNFSWLIADRIGRAAVNMMVGVMVARHLGPGDFGVLSFSVALAGIFSVLGGLGIEAVVVRDLVQESTTALWRAAWQLRLAMAGVAYVVMVGAAFGLRASSTEVVMVTTIVGLGLFFAPVDLVDLWFQARGRVWKPALVRQIVLWLCAGWRLWLVAVQAPLVMFAVASAVESALVAIALWLVFPRRGVREGDEGSVAGERRRLVREGLPLLASGLLVTATMLSDRLVLGFVSGDAAVGVYAAGVRLTELFHVVPLAFGAAMMPRLTTLRKENEARYWFMAGVSMVSLALAGVAAGAALTVAAPWLVVLLFGATYAPAVGVLQVHAWTLLFIFIVSLRTRLLVIEGSTRSVLAMSLLTALINIGGNFILIPHFGSQGAAWAAVIAWALAALALPFLFGPARQMTKRLAQAVAQRGR